MRCVLHRTIPFGWVHRSLLLFTTVDWCGIIGMASSLTFPPIGRNCFATLTLQPSSKRIYVHPPPPALLLDISSTSDVRRTACAIRLDELNGSHTLCGLARLIMGISEVPFFYLSGSMIRLLGIRGVIVLAQSAYVVRFLYYSVSQ